jgi:hypothetical protein
MYVVMSLSVCKWQSSLFEYVCLYKYCDRVSSDNSALLGYYAASSENYHFLLHNSPEEQFSATSQQNLENYSYLSTPAVPMMTSSFFHFAPPDILIYFSLVYITANLSDSGRIT